ncbi:hypothetical protein [Achromobacter xylosoxidans]|jgi:uncharacterized membrane-anchored protein|uniref:hypothetical protein n=1 Tax=Alcaligenes xylosoxydans xylosoxydans TaxID=85698 RepID=UPI000A55B96D|nr:hypothetical protein [Achromobacter xylosoxidans]
MSKLLELLISQKNSLEKKILKYPIKNKSSFEDFELLSLQVELSETITKIDKLKNKQKHQKQLDREKRFLEKPTFEKQENLKTFLIYLLMLSNKSTEHKIFLSIAINIFLGDSNEQKFRP